MAEALTLIVQQYQRLRGSVPVDVLLLYRRGDVYELFLDNGKD